MEIPVPIQPSWLRRPAPVGFPGLAAPTRLFDQRFGEGLLEAELAALCPQALAPYYLRAPSVALPTDPGPGEASPLAIAPPCAPGPSADKEWPMGISPALQVTLAKGHFSVLLDVKHFSPEEITVKVVGDHMEVHARHEERPDEHGFISREFHRRYRLPEGVDPAAVTSGLSPEGILSIQAAAPGTPTAERTVPIAQGPQAGAK
ncbi:heat shock protein beta-6 isoform X1 [Monodelphis domestica]|uniref:heat shock protein beta-6 isoform X1 n=1 Tax=Monodelphis domestica TaxID=13616 RepID=UPI0024E222B6|nr:heat shock protein beta-6 isoform X1 [Monodelphis domestica]